MKILFVILSIFSNFWNIPFCSPISSVNLEKSELQRSGREAISFIRASFDEGKYDIFLTEMDASYIAAREKGQLNQLAAMRTTGHLSEKQAWETQAQLLQDEKNQALVQAVQGQPLTPFTEKILYITRVLSDSTHREAISRVADFRVMSPGTGKHRDENRLIDLDLEYEYKLLHLNLPDSSAEEKREKQCVLHMEKLKKMLSLSAQFKDPFLKETVALYADNFDARLAQNWDLADLNAFVIGKSKPRNAIEDKIVSILKFYQEKFGELSLNTRT